MKRFVVVLASAFALVVASPVSAAVVDKIDPDDKDGKLDLKYLEVDATKDDAGFFTIKTHDGFSCNYLSPGKKNALKLEFDDGVDGDVDLVGNFVCTDKTLVMMLSGPDTGNNYEPLKVKRKSRKVMKVSFQLDLEEFKAEHLGVRVRSKDRTDPACDPACKDKIPGKGFLEPY